MTSVFVGCVGVGGWYYYRYNATLQALPGSTPDIAWNISSDHHASAENVFLACEVFVCLFTGVNAFNMFMSYKHSFMLDDPTMYAVFQRCKDLGALALVRPENGHLVELVRWR